MADQKRWFKVWTSIIANGDFAEMNLEDIGRWALLGAATALDGDNGVLEIPGEGKELCRLLRVATLADAKCALSRLKSVQYEEGKIVDDTGSVYKKNKVIKWHKWLEYQKDSTKYERQKKWRETEKCRRTKRRGDKDKEKEENKKREEVPPTSPSSSGFEIPTWIDKEAWNGFVEMRKHVRSPLTEHAKKLAIKELNKLKEVGNDPTKVLNQSTMRSWKGLFKLEGGDNGTGRSIGSGGLGTQSGSEHIAGAARPTDPHKYDHKYPKTIGGKA